MQNLIVKLMIIVGDVAQTKNDLTDDNDGWQLVSLVSIHDV